jgi:hypothetical protein
MNSDWDEILNQGRQHINRLQAKFYLDPMIGLRGLLFNVKLISSW